MLDATLVQSLDLREDAISETRLAQFRDLYSQSSLQERCALYELARTHWTGQGHIFDLGSAAGGSSTCLALGVLDSQVNDKQNRVHCFDLFEGYSVEAFSPQLEERGDEYSNDIDFFMVQTKSVEEVVVPHKVDLGSNFLKREMRGPVELAHIDAAKNLRLWKSIFRVLAPAVIPGKTIWVFQDFERIRLPWQIYSTGALLDYGEFVGGSREGTLCFRINEPIPGEVIRTIEEDALPLSEKLDYCNMIYDILDERYSHLYPGRLADYRIGSRAYCYYWENQIAEARRLFGEVSAGFRQQRSHQVYIKEIESDDA